MRTINLIFLAVCIALGMQAQTHPLKLSATLKKNYSSFKKGDKVEIRAVSFEKKYEPIVTDVYYLLVNDQKLEVKEKLGDRLDFSYQSVQDLWNAEIISNLSFASQYESL